MGNEDETKGAGVAKPNTGAADLTNQQSQQQSGAGGAQGADGPSEAELQAKAAADAQKNAGAGQTGKQEPEVDPANLKTEPTVEPETLDHPELGSEVELFEHNVDAVTSEPTDGYQAAKKAKVVKVTDGSTVIDVRTEDANGLGTISHDVEHASKIATDANYWDYPAKS